MSADWPLVDLFDFQGKNNFFQIKAFHALYMMHAHRSDRKQEDLETKYIVPLSSTILEIPAYIQK